MPIATRTFRVFVSSTFEDLKAERDALQHDVFPKLRTLCEQHGARFQAIDLRWGVRDEAALDQQTMEICLREIQRCKATGVRPNFIALLGDRYGWRPLPATIPASEFEALKPHLSVRDAGVALQWYRLDENAVPPEYCLQPRTGEFVEPSAWNPVEESLLQALTTAARAAGLSEEELIKYEASATHQEILAGLGETEEDRQHVFGFVRRPTGKTDTRLDALKSHLRVHEFDAGDMKGLCELVLTQLTKVIEAEVKRFENRPMLDLEIEAHDRFAEDRNRIFVGRQTVLSTIADYIRGPERRPLVLLGESGSGKSAVMARASEQYKGPGRVIRRFIGASPESASGHALLTSLCRQIAPGETPVDYAQLENAFRERLSVATAEQPLVLFIDALDQLAVSDPARDVTWLPSELPPNVKVILSTTDDGKRLPEGVPVRIEPMPRSEGGQALEELLRDAWRTLQLWQRETVLAHFERCGLPLYLKLAAEESRLWKSYTPANACTLGEGVTGIIDTLFDRLASNANHGPTLVARSLGYLAAARYGLTEDEVMDVLTADDAVWTDFDQRKHHEVSERRLPVVVWSRLSLDLEPYLTERAVFGDNTITFFHRQLAERAVPRNSHHLGLADFFISAATAHTGVARWRTDVPRALSEIPYQQTAAALWSELSITFGDVEFLEATCLSGMSLDLLGNFDYALDAWGTNRDRGLLGVEIRRQPNEPAGTTMAQQRSKLRLLFRTLLPFAVRGSSNHARPPEAYHLPLLDLKRCYVSRLSAIAEQPAYLAQELIFAVATLCPNTPGARAFAEAAQRRMNAKGRPWIFCTKAPPLGVSAEARVSITKHDEIAISPDQNEVFVGAPHTGVRRTFAPESLVPQQAGERPFPEPKALRRSVLESGEWESCEWLITADQGDTLALSTPWFRAVLSEYGFLKVAGPSGSNADLALRDCSAMAVSPDGKIFSAVGSTVIDRGSSAWCIVLSSADEQWNLVGPFGGDQVNHMSLVARRLAALDGPEADSECTSIRELFERVASFRSSQPGLLVAMRRVAWGSELAEHLTYKLTPTALAFTANSRSLMIGFGNGNVVIVALPDWSEFGTNTLAVTECEEYQTSWSIQSLAASKDDMFYALDTLGRLKCLRRSPGHLGSPSKTSVHFSANGRRHAVTSYNGLIEITERIESFKREMDIPAGTSDFSFTPDSKSLVCVGSSTTVAMIDIEKGRKQTIREWGTPCSIQFSPDGRLVALGYSPNESPIPADFLGLRVFDYSSGRETARCNQPFTRAVFTSVGDGLFVPWVKIMEQRRNHVTLFDTSDFSHRRDYYFESSEFADVVCNLSPSPCGRFLAVGLTDPSRVAVVSTSDGRLVRSIGLGGRGLVQIAFSPCGSYIAAIEKDGLLRFFNFSTTEEVASLELPADLTSFAWSPCGTTLLIGLGIGGVMTVEPRCFRLAPPIVTGSYRHNGSGPAGGTGRRELTAVCPFCGSEVLLPNLPSTGRDESPSKVVSPIASGRTIAFEAMLTEASCPTCRQRLRVAKRGHLNCLGDRDLRETGR